MNTFSSWLESVEKKIETASQLIGSALEDDEKSLGLTYVTPRIIAMGFPPCLPLANDAKKVDPRLPAYLKKRHGTDRYLVWNLSEVSYDGLSAVEFRFPGHPSAPLGALFELCTSLDSWLTADPSNVAVVHCLTGKGRTLTVLACYLAWSGFNEFTPQQALEYVCKKKELNLYEATIPSQRRYVEYFSRALDGVRPRSEPILLKSARAFGVPKNSILQAYVDGSLTFTGKASSEDGNGVVNYLGINATLDGDVLLRIRSEDPKSKVRVSVFRVAIHSGYTPSGTFRLERGDLDGGSPDAWMEIEFEPATDRGSQSNVKITKGVATSENAFWEMISKRRVEIRNKAVESGNSAFTIAATPLAPTKGDINVTDSQVLHEGTMPEQEIHEEEDELEKELGQLLDGSNKKTATPAPVPSPPSIVATPANDEGDEELEQYLKKLGEQ